MQYLYSLLLLRKQALPWYNQHLEVYMETVLFIIVMFMFLSAIKKPL